MPRVLTKPLFGIVNQWVGFGAQNGGTDWGGIANDINTGVGVGIGVLGGNYGLTANQTFRYAQGGQSAKALSAAHTAHSLKVARAFGRVNVITGILGTGVSINNVVTNYQQGGWNQVNGWDVSDALVGTGGVAAGIFLASNPIGWGIAIATGVYFGARLVYDLSNAPK